MIKVKNLTKKFGGITAVDSASFEIKKGEIVGFLGPNGAGKTTTIRILTGYLSADEGEVNIDGNDIIEDSIKVRQIIGYLPENNPLYEDMNVEEYLKYAAAIHQIKKEERSQKIKAVTNSCGLSNKLKEEIGNLSKGFKQRVGLAQALINEPDIIFFDEPTEGLDPNQRIEIRELIKKIGKEKTVVIASHVLSEVEATCNRVLIINKGKIVASGSPHELQAKIGGKNVINLKVEGTPSEITQKLKNLKGVEEVREVGKDEENNLDLEITCDKDMDLRKDIINFVLNNGYQLLKISQKEVTLEDVFTQLTK